MLEPFQGVCPVLNTPFAEDGEVDLQSFASLVEYAIAEGCESLALFAMNSEPTRLTTAEKVSLMEVFLSVARGRVQTAIGLVEESVRAAGEFARRAEDAGADAVILFPPGRVPPAGERLMRHLEAIANAVRIPAMYQDAPRTTGVAVTTDFLLAAHRRIPGLRYVKVECPLPVLRIDAIVEATRGSLRCMSGNGGIYTVDGFRRGAWGVMPGVALAGRFVALHAHVLRGELDAARAIFENAMPLLWFEDQSLDFFIACEKHILRRAGVIRSDHVRDHGLTLTGPDRDELEALLARLHPPARPAGATDAATDAAG